MGVMKWRTRQWHGQGPDAEHLAELTDAECEAAEEAYQRHREAVLPRLPDGLRLLAGEPDDLGYVSLHDGEVDWWVLDGSRSLTLEVVCSFESVEASAAPGGCRRVVIQYRERVELIGANEADLQRWLDNARTVFLYDEVDVLDDGRFEHRHLLWPRGEFGVRFDDIVVVSVPMPGSVLREYLRRRDFESSAAFPRLVWAREAKRNLAHDLRRRLANLAFAIEEFRGRGEDHADGSEGPKAPE
jgi:hypothetical protein